MAHHMLDGPAFEFGRDLTSPVEITPYAPPIHPECCMVWGSVRNEICGRHEAHFHQRRVGTAPRRRESEEYRRGGYSQKPERSGPQEDPPCPSFRKLLTFQEAVKARKPAGGNASASFRTASIYLLMSVAMRCGRKIHFDPLKNQVIGDEEANRLINQPMRGPWRLS